MEISLAGMNKRNRSIDVLRGAVMVLMAVDHMRTYGGTPLSAPADPMDLAVTPPLLFVLRWLSHFCAPVFAFLMGVSAFLSGGSSSGLWKRGLALVVLEFTVVNFVWAFTPFWPRYFFQVIAALGVSLMALAVLRRGEPRVALVVGLVMVFGHNLLDGVRFAPDSVWHYVWSVLHQKNVLPLWPGFEVRTTYPVLPIAGLAAVGYGMGEWFRAAEPPRRRLAWAGAGCLLLFVVLRVTNVYGDPGRFAVQATWLYTLFSLGNVTKYPLSLQFMLMTIGPALLFLAWAPQRVARGWEWLETLGQVPMFFYVAHLAVLHALALVLAMAFGFTPGDFRHNYGGLPPGFLYPLWWSFFLAVGVSWALVPLCRWYGAVKRGRRWAWTAYL